MCNCGFNIECRGEGKRRSFNLRLPMFKGGFDRIRKDITVEVEMPRQHPDIIEVLHTTVDAAEVDHGLKFFSYGRLTAVCLHPGCWKVKNRWIVAEEGFGRNVRIESDVKLKRHPRVVDPALKSNTDTFIVCVLPDDTTDNRCRIENYTIRFNFDLADFTDEILDRSDVVIHSSEQVYIHGWPLQWCIPDPQHKGTLE